MKRWQLSERIDQRKAAETHSDHLVITIDVECRPGCSLPPEARRAIDRSLGDIGHGELGGSSRPFVGPLVKFAWDWQRKAPTAAVVRKVAES